MPSPALWCDPSNGESANSQENGFRCYKSVSHRCTLPVRSRTKPFAPIRTACPLCILSAPAGDFLDPAYHKSYRQSLREPIGNLNRTLCLDRTWCTGATQLQIYRNWRAVSCSGLLMSTIWIHRCEHPPCRPRSPRVEMGTASISLTSA